jgi:ubiquinol-cytochrome c reductase subunit 7
MVFGPLGPSLAPQIRSSRSLYRWVKPIADWYASVAGYRKVGLKYDDLRTLAFICFLPTRTNRVYSY